ncbi:hypothetical protein XAB3213_3330004 [Xanthomonas citri pv. bilvae]|nr:hypothetical protein XAB3213_3330004 [Xanthomonas citri pv. bilvae]
MAIGQWPVAGAGRHRTSFCAGADLARKDGRRPDRWHPSPWTLDRCRYPAAAGRAGCPVAGRRRLIATLAAATFANKRIAKDSFERRLDGYNVFAACARSTGDMLSALAITLLGSKQLIRLHLIGRPRHVHGLQPRRPKISTGLRNDLHRQARRCPHRARDTPSPVLAGEGTAAEHWSAV